MSRKSVQSSKKTYILSKKTTRKGQKVSLTSTVAGERSALESPLMEDECDRPGKSEERERERESTAESGKRSVSHATSAVSDFRLKVCLDGAKKRKRKRKKDVVNHEDKSLLLPLHCSPPPSVSPKSVWALRPAHRLFLLGRSL